MTKKLLRLLATLVLMTAAVVNAETLTNDSVIQLHKLGLGDSVVIEKIKASTCQFDTTIEGLKTLKEAGLSDGIIQTMLLVHSPAPAPAAVVAATPAAAAPAVAALAANDPNNPAAPHASGIYLYQVVAGKPTLKVMSTSRVDGMKTGSPFDEVFDGGSKTRAILNGPHAQLQITNTAPVFYFYFTNGLQSSLGSLIGGTSPQDYTLGMLEAHLSHDKPVRRLEISSDSLGGSRSGLSAKDVRTFTTEKIADGVFKVTPTELTPGEYVFVQIPGRNIYGVKMFDFGIAETSK